MLRRLYDWTMSLAAHRRASWALAGVSFAESSVFPIPPDVLLLPMVLADRAAAFRLALICTLASLAGACLGYAIGFWGYDLIGKPIVAFYHAESAMQTFAQTYNQWGAWVVLAAAVSFLPFKVATIASGITGLGILPFLLASLAGRALRFYAVAWLAYAYGPTIRDFIERYFNLLSLVFVIVLLLGFFLIGYMS
jgi:membrane protein YqaA with SNARE-associated domain